MVIPSTQLSDTPGAAEGPGFQGPCALAIVDGTGRLDAKALGFLRDNVGAAMRFLGAGGEVSVRVVDDAEMGAAHAEYLDQEGTTDVITFQLSESPPGDRPLLDVDMLVCLDEAARQGDRLGHPPEREILLYIVHGVLHCLGFDDHDPEGSAAMHAKEDEILRAIGVGDTFTATGARP